MDRKELLEALDRVAPGLSPKESIEQSDCYVFLGDRVVTFNDEIAVSYPIDTDIEGAINAKKLYEILKRIKDQDIALSVHKGELRLKGKKGKGGIRIQDEIELPIDQFKGEKDWVPCPHGFAKALQFALYTVSKDENMGVCTGVHVSDTFVESTDNFRVSRKFYEDLELPFDDFVIPAPSARQLINYSLGEIYVDGSWAHFRTEDDTEISCRIYNEDFPDLNRFVEDFSGTTVDLPEDFAGIVSRAGVFSDIDDEVSLDKVRITLHDNELTVKGENSQKEYWEESTEVEYDDEQVEFYSSPGHMIEMFNITRRVAIGESLIRFEKEDDFIYITAMITEE